MKLEEEAGCEGLVSIFSAVGVLAGLGLDTCLEDLSDPLGDKILCYFHEGLRSKLCCEKDLGVQGECFSFSCTVRIECWERGF